MSHLSIRNPKSAIRNRALALSYAAPRTASSSRVGERKMRPQHAVGPTRVRARRACSRPPARRPAVRRPAPSAAASWATRSARLAGSVSHSITWAANCRDLSSHVRYSGIKHAWRRPDRGDRRPPPVFGNKSSVVSRFTSVMYRTLRKNRLHEVSQRRNVVQDHRRLGVVEQLQRHRARDGHRTSAARISSGVRPTCTSIGRSHAAQLLRGPSRPGAA